MGSKSRESKTGRQAAARWSGPIIGRPPLHVCRSNSEVAVVVLRLGTWPCPVAANGGVGRVTGAAVAASVAPHCCRCRGVQLGCSCASAVLEGE